MIMDILQASVVVLAEYHNPSILHPSFLLLEGIVDKEWELAEPPICTPPLAIVKYTNGIHFTAEVEKFQVIDTKVDSNLSDSEAPKLVRSYIEKLPHVRYKAVGINFVGFISISQPEEYLLEKFLKPGSWYASDAAPRTIGLTLVYNLDGAELRYKCDAGVRNVGSEQGIHGIALNANYHIDLESSQPQQEINRILDTFDARFGHFLHFSKEIFNIEI